MVNNTANAAINRCGSFDCCFGGCAVLQGHQLEVGRAYRLPALSQLKQKTTGVAQQQRTCVLYSDSALQPPDSPEAMLLQQRMLTACSLQAPL